MSEPSKYVVICEIDSGYMDCVAICDNADEAYGKAYLELIDGLDEDNCYVTLPKEIEGENGYFMEVVDGTTKEVLNRVTILFYEDGGRS